MHGNCGERVNTPGRAGYSGDLPGRRKATPSRPRRFEMECSYRVREGSDLRTTRSSRPIRRPDFGDVRAKPARVGSKVPAYSRRLRGDPSKLATFHTRSLRPSAHTKRHQILVACEENG